MEQCYNINVHEKFHSETRQNFLFQTGLLHHSGVAWRMVTDYATKLIGAQNNWKQVHFGGGGIKEESFTVTLFHKGKQYTHNFTYSWMVAELTRYLQISHKFFKISSTKSSYWINPPTTDGFDSRWSFPCCGLKWRCMGNDFHNIQSHVNAHLQEITLQESWDVSTIKSVVYQVYNPTVTILNGFHPPPPPPPPPRPSELLSWLFTCTVYTGVCTWLSHTRVTSSWKHLCLILSWFIL